MSTDPSTRSGGSLTSYEGVQASSEFAELRHRFRRFVLPATAFFLAWYFLYVLCAAYAPDFMSIRVWGYINVGLVFGLLQFVTTFAITMVYARWADRKFDPTADELREHWERGELT